ncbi:peptidoglycan-binding protein [Rhodobacterales bacterium HKCCE3408]|nr:peptidoglycan-binding protein [Rhodobacterales bacterium HKCCE3408]
MRQFLVQSLLVAILAIGLAPAPVAAQAQNFVQMEAHPDLATAESRARAYARLVSDVNGFRLPATGWYAIALGPYPADEANAVLQRLLNEGLAPRDAYVENRPIYGQQFWPAGAEPEQIEEQPLTQTQTTPLPQTPDETPAEARQSEAQLDATQRETLQIAMQWFGFYNAAIDGDFGPGTRGAMQAWQASKGYEATGILTTRQRTELLDDYRAELNALGMRVVTDSRAGIEMNMPMAMVEFDAYDYPFARYEEIDGSGVRILLISQEGTSRTLGGLYEIMQTLEIVPLQGERRRDAESFLLTGRSATIRSHTEARLQDGQIKGFTLIWPPERDDQMARVLPMMQESFTPIPGVLDPAAISDETMQGVDLVSGLEVRTPEISRSGFWATSNGIVMTSAEVVDGQCTRILIDDRYEAELAFRDDALGLAVLRPAETLAPPAHADFATGPLRLRSDIALAGFPYEGDLPAATLNFGQVAELSGLDGDTRLRRLDLDTEPAEAGGPVMDLDGNVIGMAIPQSEDGRALPPGVSFAVSSETLAGILSEQGLVAPTEAAAAPRPSMGREALARYGADLAVLVSCWN